MNEKSSSLSNLENNLKKWRDGNIDPVTRIFWGMNAEIISNLSIEYSNCRNKVLDIGCGVGSYIIKLAKQERDCYGLDPLLETSLLMAQHNASVEPVDIELFRGCGEHLPFKDSTFDMILCVSTLQHVKDQTSTLKEIRNLLKNDGFLIVSVPQTIRRSTFEKLGTYTMHFNTTILNELLKKGGFEILEIKYCGFLQPVFRRVLNNFHPILGEYNTKVLMNSINNFARYLPGFASSVIVLARVDK